ncbi:unnamed protein product, partial [Arabidopsis halleri]
MDMDSRNPYHHPSSFLNLLNSQGDRQMLTPIQYEGFSPTIDLLSSDVPMFGTG